MKQEQDNSQSSYSKSRPKSNKMHRRNSKITWILALFVLLPLGSGLPINERTLSRGPLSQISLSRRDLFSFVSSSPLTFIILFPQSVSAAAPITQGETENLGAKAQRFFRPKPPKILRKKVDKDLAVLLMRSSYNALDDLNCIPMDQFQRDFFIIRQAEYEPYVDSLGQGLVRQGDLTDPYYFDFISYAQYHTINREITQNPPYIFEEKQPVEVGEGKSQEFTTVVVRRDPSIANQMLPLEHSKRVGKSILDQFDERYGNTPAALPKPDLNGRPDSSECLSVVCF